MTEFVCWKKDKADPDAKLLEHRGVTVSELATELNGGWAGSITIQKVTFFSDGGFCEGGSGSCVSFLRVFDLLELCMVDPASPD
jgi:hypothetical protein